ncbi:MAG: MAPEG family protein [Rhodospirillales bacterium]
MANIPLPMTALYAGMLGLMLVALGLMVVRQRYRARVGLFDGGDLQLGRAIRVHGNFCEYLPFALILMAAVEINGAPDWALHGIGVVLIVARLLHAYGLWRSDGPSSARFAGTVGTFLVIATAAVYAIVQYNGYVRAI